MKVLVAEDAGVMRTIICRVLNSLGVEHIQEAVDGAQAWQAFQADDFDLVITDWHMPRIDGIDLVKMLRVKDATVPIIMVSVVDTRSMVVRALKAGVTDYLCKPFQRDELEKKIVKYWPADTI